MSEGEVAPGKLGGVEGDLGFPDMDLRREKTSEGLVRGERLEDERCQASALALAMTAEACLEVER